jgi:hypothetical protein
MSGLFSYSLGDLAHDIWNGSLVLVILGFVAGSFLGNLVEKVKDWLRYYL